jgi:hypothetical protein
MSDTDELTDKISGADSLIKLFGYWPSFHDAEIVELCLRTQGISELKIRLTGEKSLAGSALNVIIVFEMAEIESLELLDFYSQNIILELVIIRTGSSFKIDIDGSVGLSGTFTTKQLSVKILDS